MSPGTGVRPDEGSSSPLRGHGKRVLIVTATDRRRGAEIFTTRLSRGLEGRGWAVKTVSLTRSGEPISVDIEPITRVSSDSPGRFNLEILRALSAVIRQFRPDVVVANGGPTLRYSAACGLISPMRLAYIAIGEPQYWIRSRFARLINELLLRRVDYVMAVSEKTRRQLLDMVPSLADRAAVTYTGIPEEMFGVDRKPHDGPLHVLMIGSLSKEKDPLLGVAVIAATDDVVGRIVGSGPLQGEVREEIARLDSEGEIELVGSVTDIKPHLKWADVLLLTSKTEGLPGAILEASAAGVPTLAVDVGGVADAVVHRETGLMVERDISALIESLRWMSVHRDEVTAMGVKARELARRKFSMTRIVAGYADRLEELMR